MKSNSIKNNNSNSDNATKVHRDRITNLLNRRNNNTNNPEAVNENANIRPKTSLPSNSGSNIPKVEITYDMGKNVIQLKSVTSLGEIGPNQINKEATKTDKQQAQKSSSPMQSSSSSNVTLSSSSTNGFSSPKQSDSSSNNQAYKKTTETPTEKSRNIILVYSKSKHKYLFAKP